MDLFHHPIPDLPGVPRQLVDLLRHGMANDPADRPTAEQLRSMLGEVRLDGPPPPSFVPPPRYGTGDETPTVRTPMKPSIRKRFFGLLGIEDR
jgi:hypothetical protein